MNNWTIGEVKITCVTELENAGHIIQESIPNATKDAVKTIDWLMPNYANKNGILGGHTQGFVVEAGDLRVLIDTCVGNGKKRIDIKEWGNLNTDFLQKLNASGYHQDDITHVICTHLHFDHVGFNTSLENQCWIPTFKNAKYIFSKKEYEYWQSMPSKEIEDDRQGIIDSVLPIIKLNKHLLVEDDFTLSDNISLVPTPGHTPHHVSVLVKSQGRSALITGDFIHHPCQMEHTSWYALADTDKHLAKLTREKMLKKYSDTDTLVFGSHFCHPVSGYIRKQYGGYRFCQHPEDINMTTSKNSRKLTFRKRVATKKVVDKADSPEELVDIVDKNDIVVGQSTKGIVNSDPSLLHREITVLIIDKKGRVLVQQRSKFKKNMPLAWTLSVAGYVPSGMSYEEAAHKELVEELGFDTKIVAYNKDIYYQPMETQIVTSFVGVFPENTSILINKDEVESFRFISKDDLNIMQETEEFETDSLKDITRYFDGEYGAFISLI